jgi:hypothetical protein
MYAIRVAWAIGGMVLGAILGWVATQNGIASARAKANAAMVDALLKDPEPGKSDRDEIVSCPRTFEQRWWHSIDEDFTPKAQGRAALEKLDPCAVSAFVNPLYLICSGKEKMANRVELYDVSVSLKIDVDKHSFSWTGDPESQNARQNCDKVRLIDLEACTDAKLSDLQIKVMFYNETNDESGHTTGTIDRLSGAASFERTILLNKSEPEQRWQWRKWEWNMTCHPATAKF